MYTFDASILSDLHKDAYGFRPSESFYARWGAMSDDQRQTLWNELCDAVQCAIDDDRRREANAIAAFEALVDVYQATVVGWSRDQAIEAILDGSGLTNPPEAPQSYIIEDYEWNVGLPFGYIDSHR